MMKSMRSLLQTMTPTPRRQKEDKGTPDTAAESPEPPPPMDIPHLYRLLDTQIRVNIGTSVKCGICLSTLQTPTRTPCGHAFCKPCILASLRSTAKCPECNTKITKRALQPAHEQLQKLAMVYKQSLVEFGFAPGIYQAGFTTLTQKPPSDPDDSDEDSDNDNDDDQPGSEKDRSDSDKDKKQLALDRLHVAATWQHHSVPTTKIQQDENALVVQANTKACEVAGWVVGQPPTTQDILDQAREQQVADTALEDSFHDHSTPPPRSTGQRRVSFEPVVISASRQRPIPKPSSSTGSPFLAPSLSPIAQEGSQRSETEPNMEDCKPSAVSFCVDQHADAVVGVASCRSPPTPNEAEPSTKVAATCEPPNEPTKGIESKSESKEPTSTSSSFKSILESHSQSEERMAASTGCPTEKTHPPPKGAEVSGVVEDSFGALHWTNKSNISLTLSSMDEPEDSTLSLTQHHEEPPLEPRLQKNEGTQEKEEPEDTKLDTPHLEEDSDATVPMSSDTVSIAIEQEDNNKMPSAATSFRRRANSEPSLPISTAFAVGDIVNVQCRTWSGINKPGGVARITKINPDHTYNVAYVLGGRETNVDSVFVTATESTDKRRRRETTLPVYLLQALEAQGFDTTGQLTLEHAPTVPKKEKVVVDTSNRKSNRKGALQDLSNQPTDGKNKRRRRENTLPVSLLRELEAQGFDTTGKVILEQAPIVPKQEKEDSSRRKPNRKGAHNDQPNQPGDSNGDNDDVKPIAKKAKASTSSSRRVRNATTSATTEELPGGKPNKKRNRPNVNPAQATTDGSDCKKQGSKRNKTGDEDSDAPKVNEERATSTDEKRPRLSTAVSVLETLKEADRQANDDICKVADSHYQARFEAELQEHVIHAVASGLSEDDMGILKALTSKSLANDVRIKLGDRITKKTTLCITPLEIDVSTGNSTTLLRTVKVMRASLAGIPIVSPKWLYECEKKAMAKSLSPHLVARSLPTKAGPASFCDDSKHGVARMAALVAKKAPSPLHNHYLFFCGAFEASHRKDLQLLAREAGAKVLTNVSAVTKKLGKAKVILVCHDVPTTGTLIPPSLLEAVRTSLTTTKTKTTMVVNVQWIFESVTCAKVIPSHAFAPVNVKARELWQLGQES